MVSVVLMLAILTISPALGATDTILTKQARLTIITPDKPSENGFNQIILTVEKTSSYPVDAHITIVPSSFSYQKEWVYGDAKVFKTGSGIRIDIDKVNQDTVRILVPGNAINVGKGFTWFKQIQFTTSPDASAVTQGMTVKSNYETASITSQATAGWWDSLPLPWWLWMILLGLLAALIAVEVKG
jgi:hypothetical protein